MAVTADDVELVVAWAAASLAERLDVDWRVPATGLEWDCWETLEHVSEGLLYYAMQLIPVPSTVAGGYAFLYRAERPGGPEGVVFADPAQGQAGLVRIVARCGGLLASAVRTAPSSHRAHHTWGESDVEGFAAMGVVETLAHMWDVAAPLGLDWPPSEDVCRRALDRLFPDAPTDGPAGDTLLWAMGRGELPGLPRLGEDWSWHSSPRLG